MASPTQDVPGDWLSDYEMHPETNIFGRKWGVNGNRGRGVKFWSAGFFSRSNLVEKFNP